MTKKEITKLSDHDLLSGLQDRLKFDFQRTMELAHFVAEAHRRGFDLQEMSQERLTRYLRLSSGEILPEVFKRFSASRWLTRFENYDLETQARIITGTFRVFTEKGIENLSFDAMTPEMRERVFSRNKVRSVDEQQKIECGMSPRYKSIVGAIASQIGRWEREIDNLDETERRRVIALLLDFAKRIGFEGEEESLQEMPDDVQKLCNYLEIHGSARPAVIAADLEMNPKVVSEMLHNSRRFTHRGDGYFCIRESQLVV